MSLPDAEYLRAAAPYVQLFAQSIGLLRLVLAHVWRSRQRPGKGETSA